ncbi:MAG: NUDIX hydrolase [Myxococcales bacterium]|nr:NUDIX hydrolase [Myxococcales bacterium]
MGKNRKKRSAGILFLHDGRLLLLQRSPSARNPHKWGLPGGQLDKRETAYQGALRESIEELGSIPRHDLHAEIVVRRHRKEYRVFLASTRCESWRPELNEEHLDHRWVRMDWCDRKSKRLHPVVRAVLRTGEVREHLDGLLH